MSIDKDRIRFRGKLIVAALEYKASIDHNEGKEFIDVLYKEWLSTNKSIEDCKNWLKQRLEGVFMSLNQEPRWVEEEPTWPFFKGNPMVFLGQFSMSDSYICQTELSPGETVYLFAIRDYLDSGYEMVYRTVSQFTE